MHAKRKSLGDQIRAAVKASAMSQNALCRATAIDKAAMSRFVTGKVGLQLANLEAVADHLGLHLTTAKPAGKAKTPRKAR